MSYDTSAPTQTPVEPPAPAPVAAPAPTPTGTDYNPQLGGAPNGDPTISTTTDSSLFGNLPNVTPTQATIGGAAAAVASGGSGNNQAPAPVPPPAATPVQTPTQPPVIDPFGGTFGAGNTDPNTGLPTGSNNATPTSTPTQQAPSPTMPTSTPASNTVDPYGGTTSQAATDLTTAASSSTPLDATGLSGSSLWDYLTSKPVLGAVGNYLINQSQAQSYADLAKQAASAGNVLNQPQRLPFQQAATSATNDPANWLKTNPFSTSLAAYYKNNVIPQQVAKSGNASNVIDTQGSQFATALAGNYNNYVNTMGTMGGFTQGAGYSAPAMVQAGIPGIQSQGQSYNNASNLLFGLPATNTGTSTNPVSGSQSIFS